MRNGGDRFTSVWASKNIKNFENLQKIANRICDPALLSVPELPIFCTNSLGEWRVYDSETIDAQVKSDDSYRKIISDIDKSHPLGVGYILCNPPQNRRNIDIIFDKILSRWQESFDLGILLFSHDYTIQFQIIYHENLLIKLDSFFENIINSAMPHKLRNLLKMSAKTEKTLEDINMELDKLDLPKLKENAFILLIDKIDGNKFWDRLVTYSTDGDVQFVTVVELKDLLNHFISVMYDKKFIKDDYDSFYLLHKHLHSRRLYQNELRTNAEGSLKTQSSSSQERYSLSKTEIRDPSNRCAYIDLSVIVNATDFRDIIIAAALIVDARFDIVSIEQKMLARKALLANLGAKYKQAKDEKSIYFPTKDELLAIELEQIDDFIQDKYAVGGMDYLTAAIDKLKRFLLGDKLGLCDAQIRVLQDNNLVFLKPLFADKKPKSKAYSSTLACYSILGKRRASQDLTANEFADTDEQIQSNTR